MNLKIGFVILTWNSDKVIEACLSSIYSMQKIDCYVIVVDNGSSDQTRSILSKLTLDSASDLEVIYYDTNKGTTLTRNVGLKQLEKYNLDYYCVLDSDTIVNEDCFYILSNEMVLHKDYGLIGPRMITSNGFVQISARSFPTVLEKICKGIPIKRVQKIGEQMEVQYTNKKDKSSYPVDYLMSACWLIRPEALFKTGYLDEKIFYAPEDAEYCIRMWKSGYKVAFCPKAEIIHEWQRLSKKKLFSKINWEHIKGLVYMFRKHHYFFTTKRLKAEFPVFYRESEST